MTLLAPPSADRVTESQVEDKPSSAQPEMPAAEAPLGPAEYEIAAEAYTRYLLRGCADGHAVEDWLEAERSLKDKYAASPTPL